MQSNERPKNRFLYKLLKLISETNKKRSMSLLVSRQIKNKTTNLKCAIFEVCRNAKITKTRLMTLIKFIKFQKIETYNLSCNSTLRFFEKKEEDNL